MAERVEKRADVDVVLVDVDNTLLDFEPCSAWSIERACADTGVPYSERLADTFLVCNEVFWRDIEKGKISREEMYRSRFDVIFEKVGLAPHGGETFDEVYRSYLRESCFTVEGAEDLLAYLSPRYFVYAATNASTAQQQNRLEKAGLLAYMKGLFVSDMFGAEKPRKAFFDGIFARLPGVLPSRTVMLGDSPNADVLGAKNYGMKAIWYNKNGRKRPSPVADYTVSTLAEVKTIL